MKALLRGGALLALVLTAAAARADAAGAWDLRVWMNGSADGRGWGNVVETTDARQIDCTYPNAFLCTGGYGWGWTVELRASAASGWRFDRWGSGGANQVTCDAGYAANVCHFTWWALFGTYDLEAYFVDETPPTTAISASPPSLTSSTSASFTYTAGAADVAAQPGGVSALDWPPYYCKLDGGAWEGCYSTTKSYTGLSSGQHTFQVYAQDASGNADATPATYSWTVDAVAPNTSIQIGPPAFTNSDGAVFHFSSTESGTFQCALDSGPWSAPCTSPRGYAFLSPGQHTFGVRAIDAVGNMDLTPATYTWTIDVQAPSAPGALTGTALPQPLRVSLSWGASTDNHGVAGYRVYRDGVHVASTTGLGYVDSDAAPVHTYTYVVRAYDAAGNLGAASDAEEVTTPPTFADVSATHPFVHEIEELFARGITTGCGTTESGQLLYCPDGNVLRQSMAAFIVRAQGLGTLSPTTPTFADVPATHSFFGYVERFYERGITTGCGTDGTGARIFCPTDPVKRQAMAAFITRALGLAPLNRATPTFADVPATHPFYGEIERFYEAGITGGCGTNGAGQLLFCPDALVKRQAMAAFIVRAFPS